MYLSRLLSKIFVGSKRIDSSRQSIEKQNANELDHYLYFCSKKRYFPYVWICLQMLYPMFTFLSQQSFHICCLDFFNEVIHSVKVRIELKSSWNIFESFLYCNKVSCPGPSKFWWVVIENWDFKDLDNFLKYRPMLNKK